MQRGEATKVEGVVVFHYLFNSASLFNLVKYRTLSSLHMNVFQNIYKLMIDVVGIKIFSGSSGCGRFINFYGCSVESNFSDGRIPQFEYHVSGMAGTKFLLSALISSYFSFT